MSFLIFEKLRLDLKPPIPVHRPTTTAKANLTRMQNNYMHTSKLINSKFEPPNNRGRDLLKSKSNFSFSTAKTGQNTSSLDFSFPSETQILRKASAVLKKETLSKYLLENPSSPKSAKSSTSMYNCASITSIAEEYLPRMKPNATQRSKTALLRPSNNQENKSFSPFKEVSFYEPCTNVIKFVSIMN